MLSQPCVGGRGRPCTGTDHPARTDKRSGSYWQIGYSASSDGTELVTRHPIGHIKRLRQLVCAVWSVSCADGTWRKTA